MIKTSSADQDNMLGWTDSDTDDSDAGTVESIMFGPAWNLSWV